MEEKVKYHISGTVQFRGQEYHVEAVEEYGDMTSMLEEAENALINALLKDVEFTRVSVEPLAGVVSSVEPTPAA